MSSFIEFRQAAFKIPFGEPQEQWDLAAARYKLPRKTINAWGDPNVYFILTEGGDNNVIQDNGKIARRWHLTAAGPWEESFRHICTIAAEQVLGGMVCLRTRNHWTKPENYIARYRQVMEAAPHMRELLSMTGMQFRIHFMPQRPHPWFEELKESGRLTKEEGHHILRCINSADSMADLCWLATECTQKGMPNFRLDSPLDIP